MRDLLRHHRCIRGYFCIYKINHPLGLTKYPVSRCRAGSDHVKTWLLATTNALPKMVIAETATCNLRLATYRFNPSQFPTTGCILLLTMLRIISVVLRHFQLLVSEREKAPCYKNAKAFKHLWYYPRRLARRISYEYCLQTWQNSWTN